MLLTDVLGSIGENMDKEEFIDRLFDIVNETKKLQIKDMDSDALENTITVYLADGAAFKIWCESQC